ncbi:MAG: DUF4153 domain-containing protein [Flavobacteriales bacterium]
MIPSIDRVLKGAIRTFRRFPFAILFGICWSFCLSYWLFLSYEEEALKDLLLDLSMAGYLGMLAAVFFPLLGQGKLLPLRWSPLFQGLAPLTALLYYLSLPELPMDAYPGTIPIAYSLWVLAFHFGIAFAPFVRSTDPDKFWQFNKTLFLRILTAALYTSVLFIGVAIALMSIDHLFGLDVEGEVYGVLCFLLSGIFNTWFFLAGVPEDPLSLDGNAPYPKGLKRFTQYVLLPLVTCYLLILYLYLVKVLIMGSLPQGMIAYMVLAFSIAGILAILLLYPIRELTENAWVRTYSKWFYIALFPVIGLLGVAIYLRIHQYGLTEERYFVVVLAVWLAAIATLYSFKGQRNIRIIPVSLFFLSVLLSFGPWGAFESSERDQRQRLRGRLASLQALTERGKAKQIPEYFPTDSIREVERIVGHLIERYGAEGLDPLFRTDLDSLFRADSLYYRDERENAVWELLGRSDMGRTSSWGRSHQRHGDLHSRDQDAGIQVAPYNRMFRFSFDHSYEERVSKMEFFPRANGKLTLRLKRRRGLELKVLRDDSVQVSFAFRSLLKKALKAGEDQDFTLHWPVERMSFRISGDDGGVEYGLWIERIRFEHQKRKPKWRIIQMKGNFFIGKKKLDSLPSSRPSKGSDP